MAFIALEKLHHLYDGYRRCVAVAGRNLLLFQEEGQIYLIENRCPHAGSSLNHSTITGQTLRCPQHGISFNLRTGRADNQPYKLTYFPLAYEGQAVGIYLDN